MAKTVFEEKLEALLKSGLDQEAMAEEMADLIGWHPVEAAYVMYHRLKKEPDPAPGQERLMEILDEGLERIESADMDELPDIEDRMAEELTASWREFLKTPKAARDSGQKPDPQRP